MNDRAFDALVRRGASGLDRRSLFGALTGAALGSTFSTQRVRAHDVECKGCDKKCKETIETSAQKITDACIVFAFVDPELFEECQADANKCLQVVANSKCNGLDKEKSLYAFRDCIKDWSGDFALDNPLVAIIKKFIKKLKKKK